MQRSQDIYFGVPNQVIVWDAPEGRPSSVAAVRVFAMGTGDDGTQQEATAGSPSIDAVSTTVDAASGAGQANPRLLNVLDGDDIVAGRAYLVTSAAGAREWVEAMEVVEGASGSILTRYPMANAFASADTVVGTRITVPLSSLWVSDANKLSGGRNPIVGYRARWLYTVDGAQRVHDSQFDLVRYVGGHTLMALDVDREFPGLQGMGPGFHRADGFKGLLDQAYERVKFDLRKADLADNAVMDQDALNRATLLALGMIVAKSRVYQGADLRVLELAERDYDAFVGAHFHIGLTVPVDEGSSGGSERADPAPFWVK
jgi:hypothetical protein